MDKTLINKIVKNIVHEVAKENNIEIDVKVTMEFDWSLDFDLISDSLLTRSVKVSTRGDYYEVSNGRHSPTDKESDLIQQIIVGRIAERLLIENRK